MTEGASYTGKPNAVAAKSDKSLPAGCKEVGAKVDATKGNAEAADGGAKGMRVLEVHPSAFFAGGRYAARAANSFKVAPKRGRLFDAWTPGT